MTAMVDSRLLPVTRGGCRVHDDGMKMLRGKGSRGNLEEMWSRGGDALPAPVFNLGRSVAMFALAKLHVERLIRLATVQSIAMA